MHYPFVNLCVFSVKLRVIIQLGFLEEIIAAKLRKEGAKSRREILDVK